MKILFFCIASYALGSVNPAIIIAWFLKRVDIRNCYDGNPGATNIFYSVNRQLGIFVGILDALKGFLPLFFAHRYGISGPALALVGACSILGHDFPVFFDFKGGTGISATVGGLIFFEPRFTLILLTLVFLTLRILIKYDMSLFGFTPFETIEALGFIISILYIFLFSHNYVLKIYFLLLLSVVVMRQLPRVKEIFVHREA